MGAREHGSKPGSGFTTSFQENLDRRERLRQLALETIDLDKDPYFIRNHLGQYECRLCLSLHINTGSYLAHTQGKRHQQNMARRAAKEKLDGIKSPILKPGLLCPRKTLNQDKDLCPLMNKKRNQLTESTNMCYFMQNLMKLLHSKFLVMRSIEM